MVAPVDGETFVGSMVDLRFVGVAKDGNNYSGAGPGGGHSQAASAQFFVDGVSVLGSIDLVARFRGWVRDRNVLFDRFFAGYRRGLDDPGGLPPEPEVVRRLRLRRPPPTREAFLAWAEKQMTPMKETPMWALIAAMEAFAPLVRQERPELPDGYFRIERAGWLHMGVGSATALKILIRVDGPTSDPADDVVLEAKAIRALDGVGCLEQPKTRPTARVIDGSQQIGRLKHDILVAGPDRALPKTDIQGTHLRDWWVRSWDPSYLEIGLDDLQSIEDLAEITFDSGAQLGAGSLHGLSPVELIALRTRSLASIDALQARLRREAEVLVEELLKGWRELADGERMASTRTAGPSRMSSPDYERPATPRDLSAPARAVR